MIQQTNNGVSNSSWLEATKGMTILAYVPGQSTSTPNEGSAGSTGATLVQLDLHERSSYVIHGASA